MAQEPRRAKSLIINGHPYIILDIEGKENYLVHVQSMVTGRNRWIDWMLVDALNPTKNPGALLEALAALDDEEPLQQADPGAHGKESSTVGAHELSFGGPGDVPLSEEGEVGEGSGDDLRDPDQHFHLDG
jgi:hypothetical protein